jgi:hypothetical protein
VAGGTSVWRKRPSSLPTAGPPLPSTGRIGSGSACATPFLSHARGVAENGWPRWSSVREGLDKLQYF